MSNEWIGVVAFADSGSPVLKQGALLFDGIITTSVDIDGCSDAVQELQRLGVVRECLSMTAKMPDGRVVNIDAAFLEELKRFDDAPRPRRIRRGPYKGQKVSFELMRDAMTRAHAGALQKTRHNGAFLPLVTDLATFMEKASQTSDVLRVVLHDFPLPDRTTPWQAIYDWRNDADAVRRYRRLRAWVGELCRNHIQPQDIRDQLAVLTDDYGTYMKRYHRTMRKSRAEVIATTAAGILEDLAHVKLSGAVEKLFALWKAEASLSEIELDAPGREIAYLVAAKDRFGDLSGSG